MDLRPLIAALGCAGCLGPTEGRFGFHGPHDFGFAPNECKQTDDGLNLHRPDRADNAELVIQDRDTLLVRLLADDKTVRLDRSICPFFEVHSHATGKKVNDVDVVAGTISIQCEVPDLGAFTGNASFECSP